MKREEGCAQQLRRKLFGVGPRWASMLWSVMFRTGNGYRRHSLRNTGKGKDRRKDKLTEFFGVPKRFRQYALRYASVPMKSVRERRA